MKRRREHLQRLRSHRPQYPSKGVPVLGDGVSTGTLACQEGKMMPGNQRNTKGDGLYQYNPAVEKIHTSLQNSEVAQLKAEVSRLKEKLNAVQKVMTHLLQQNQALRQKELTPEKCDAFSMKVFGLLNFLD